jgi:hypothetical protein
MGSKKCKLAFVDFGNGKLRPMLPTRIIEKKIFGVFRCFLGCNVEMIGVATAEVSREPNEHKTLGGGTHALLL